MFHLAAYFLNATNAANLQIPALSDGIIPITNNNFLPPQDMLLAAAYASGASLTDAFLVSPKIVQTNPTYVEPVNKNLLPGDWTNTAVYMPMPIKVRGQEELKLQVNDTTGTNEHVYGLAWLATQITPIPPGELYNVRFTASITATATAWTLGTITLTNTLPAGLYSMVGSVLQSTTGVAHRWIFDNQFFRPGFQSIATQNLKPSDLVWTLALGEMGKFSTYSLPRIEILCDSADTAQVGWMKLVKVG